MKKYYLYDIVKSQKYLPLFGCILGIILLVGALSNSPLRVWAIIELLLYVWLFVGGLLVKDQRGFDRLAQIFCYKTIGGLLILLGLVGSQTLSLGLILRLAIIPFHFWYLQSFCSLGVFLVILGGLLLKIFPLILWEIRYFSRTLASLTSIVGSIRIISTATFCRLLVRSRIRQRGLLIFRLSRFPFLFYLFIYYFSVMLASSRNPFFLWNLRAIPPMPIFFLKVWILTKVPLLLLIILLVRIAISFYPYLKFTLARLIFLGPKKLEHSFWLCLG